MHSAHHHRPVAIFQDGAFRVLKVGWVVNANGVHNVDIVLPSVPDGFPSLGPSPQVIQESIDLDITQFSRLACPSPSGTLQDIDNLTIGYSRSGSD